MAFYPSWPDGLGEEQEDLIAAFLESRASGALGTGQEALFVRGAWAVAVASSKDCRTAR